MLTGDNENLSGFIWKIQFEFVWYSTCMEVAIKAFAYQHLWFEMRTNFYETNKKNGYIRYAFYYR